MSDGNEPPADFSDLLPFHLVGQGSAFQQVLKTIRLVARYDVLVALYGETGTGKELVARAIHYLSSRARGPFEPINCGGLTDSLLESELFGHRRGAFTDARSDRAGLVEKANGGTLFLDEVEALSTKGQVALLRFLQDFSFRRVGGQRLRSVDTRIIAATNVPLDELVAQDSGLRQDLYFRLNVMPLRLPPLRERKEDIPLLAEYFLQRYAAQYDIESRGISDAALDLLSTHDWPGNVRELENCIHRALLLAGKERIAPRHVHPEQHSAATSPEPNPVSLTAQTFQQAKAAALAGFEQRYLEELLTRFGGNVTRAAAHAGSPRCTITRLMRKHSIRRDVFSASPANRMSADPVDRS